MRRGLLSFFSYYGGKRSSAKYYPEPVHDTIVEPFAGAAGYSTLHYERNVILYDVDPTIFGIWDYLIRSKPEAILRLPVEFDHIEECRICEEAKWLIGFWLGKGRSRPGKSPSAWMRRYPDAGVWGYRRREIIASQVDKIKHWRICNLPYRFAENTEATWFVDPPYQNNAGDRYKCSFNGFDALSVFCRNRRGQVIACEQSGATWLPFRPFRSVLTAGGLHRDTSAEVIWTND